MAAFLLQALSIYPFSGTVKHTIPVLTLVRPSGHCSSCRGGPSGLGMGMLKVQGAVNKHLGIYGGYPKANNYWKTERGVVERSALGK